MENKAEFEARLKSREVIQGSLTEREKAVARDFWNAGWYAHKNSIGFGKPKVKKVDKNQGIMFKGSGIVP